MPKGKGYPKSMKSMKGKYKKPRKTAMLKEGKIK